ncbi:MAG: hypothetical protein ACTTH0_01600 [Eubacteriales bacterium]
MIFSEIAGNDALIAGLRKNIKNGKIAHAYILEGSKSADKLKFALGFSEELGCKNPENHPDVFVISHDGITIKDEEITRVQENLMTAPMISDYNIVIIDGADTITPRAQNRMLKTLEEPVTDSIIMLLSENAQNLLATVRSRCLILRIHDANIDKSEETLKLEALSEQMLLDIQKKEPFYKLMQKYEESISVKKCALIMIDAMQKMLSEIFVDAAVNGEITAVSEAVEIMKRASLDLRIGVKPSYAMKNLVIKLEDIL